MTNRNTIDEIKTAYGRIPPQAIEVEEAVLGALMLERDAYITIADIIDTRSFYKEEHQKIFEVIKYLSTHGKPIDLLIVTQELKNRNLLEMVGGPLMITQLTSRVASASHIEHHARIIAQSSIARELIRITTERGTQAYDQSIDIDETLSGLQNDLVSLLETGKSKESTISDAIKEVYERIEWNRNNTGLSGIGTGLYNFDKFTGGLQKTDLIIIAGESSQGKTSLALSILKNAVIKYGAIATVYSLEMSKSQLVARIISQETDISAKNILNRTLASDQINCIARTAKILNDLPVFFDESSSSTIDQICISIRRLKIKHGINLVIVDYLQLIGSGLKNKTEESQIAEIARRLKNVAKELNISVIALSQLSRNSTNPKPSTNRLRGSGQILEASDVCLLIWRPVEYDITEFSEPHKGILTEGLAECIIAKGRNVGTGSFLLKFNPLTTCFYDYTPEYNQEFYRNPDQPIESGTKPF